MAVSLTVPVAGGGRRTYTDEKELSIGRDPEQVTVALKNAYVSRYHCVIRRRINGDWVLIHRGRNPSRIGDIILRNPGQQALLPPRTVLRVGGVNLELQIDERDHASDEVIQIEDLDIRDPESGWWDLSLSSIEYDEEDDERTILDGEIPDLSALGAGEESGEESTEAGSISEEVYPDSDEIDPDVPDQAETLPRLPAMNFEDLGQDVPSQRSSEVAIAEGERQTFPKTERAEAGASGREKSRPSPTSSQADIVIFEGGREATQSDSEDQAEAAGREVPVQLARVGFWRRLWAWLKRLFS